MERGKPETQETLCIWGQDWEGCGELKDDRMKDSRELKFRSKVV